MYEQEKYVYYNKYMVVSVTQITYILMKIE